MFVSMHQPDYLPWLGYFNKIAVSEAFIFFDTAFYSHSGFHDSNKIKTSNGWAYLTIPMAHSEDQKRLMDTMLPLANTRWVAKHWKSLQLNYTRAPYWQEHAPFFEDLYKNIGRFKTLADLNIHIIEYMSRAFGIQTPFHRASVLGVDPELRSTEAILQIIKKVGATEFLAGPSGKKYLVKERFAEEGVKLHFQEYHEPEHPQLFPPYIPGLSAVDLLFNEGPHAMRYIQPV